MTSSTFAYLLAIPSLIVALLAVGFLYQWLGAHFDRQRYAAGGRWIDIGDGRRLYLLEKGSGEATVLFEAGIAATNLNWFHIQKTVSQFAATASYDRSGLGWSSPSRTARTPGNLAVELHELLWGAGIKPPFILVGHSFGGLVMRRYALLYPEECGWHRAGGPHALRGVAAIGPGKTGDTRPWLQTIGIRNSHCTAGFGAACSDLASVPVRANRGSVSWRCRPRGLACAWADQR